MRTRIEKITDDGSGYLKITNPGKKYSLIIMPEKDVHLTGSYEGQLGVSGVLTSIINEGGGYFLDENENENKIIYIDENKVCEEPLFCFDGFVLTNNKLKKIFKKIIFKEKQKILE
ncbi:MAG: hypothetical protein ACEQSF_04255 [Solirubrobacteraceae bacterium]